jgi:drug/metabolite transporter (DMT)-like permease
VIVEMRLLIGASVIALIVRTSPSRESHRLADLRPWLMRGIVLSVLMAVIPFLLLALAERGVSSGTASILNATAPLWAATYVFAIARSQKGSESSLPRTQLAGLAVGTLGVAVFVGLGPRGSLVDELLVVLMALTYSGAGVYAQRVFRDAPVYAAAMLATATGAAIALPLGVAGWLAHPPDLAALLSSAAAGALPNGVAYVTYFSLIRLIGAARALTVTYLMPIVALVLGVALLGERVVTRELLGLALILIGVAAVNGQFRGTRGRGDARLPRPPSA